MTTWVSKNRGSVSCPGIKQTRIVDFRLSEGLSSQKPLILNPSPEDKPGSIRVTIRVTTSATARAALSVTMR